MKPNGHSFLFIYLFVCLFGGYIFLIHWEAEEWHYGREPAVYSTDLGSNMRFLVEKLPEFKKKKSIVVQKE